MTENNLQVLFFQHLKTALPPHLSLVDEVAELLSISNDSAYRRIRGEKPIDLEEAQTLCSRFKVSLDHLLDLQSDTLIFTGKLKKPTGDLFQDWLQNVQQQFQFVNSFQKKHLYFLIKDVPPFVHFQIPELAAFKCFFWMKSILHYTSMKGLKFSIDDPQYATFSDACWKIIGLYDKVPTTEIWNIESINSTLRQIDFYHQSGAFKNESEVKLLYSKVELLVNHIERQAETGKKFLMGREPSGEDVEYNMFVNELIMGDNTILTELDDMRITFLNHSVIYFVATRDVEFNNAMFDNLANLISKSTKISTTGEKERSQFFNRIRVKISSRLQSVK